MVFFFATGLVVGSALPPNDGDKPMRDRILRHAFEIIAEIDRLSEDPATGDEDIERLLVVRAPLHQEALAARDSDDPKRIAMVERLRLAAEAVVGHVQQGSTHA
jgi:hypothetical protein